MKFFISDTHFLDKHMIGNKNSLLDPISLLKKWITI